MPVRAKTGVIQEMSKVKKVFISQPAPADYEKSPYKVVADKFNLKIVFKKLFHIEGVSPVDFRKHKINLLDYTAVILNSRNAVDYYFRLAKDLRVTIPTTMKFFCSSESVALYIQTYMQYRKRKIFFGKQTTADLMEVVAKHTDEKFIFPCSEDSNSDIPAAFESAGIPLKKAPMYRTVTTPLAKDVDIREFDMIVMFSPMGIKSLFENYPGYQQEETFIGTFGTSVAEAADQAGLTVNLAASTSVYTSMATALMEFLGDLNRNSGDYSKIADKYSYKRSEIHPVETKSLKDIKSVKAVSRVRKPSESKVAANKAAALAVMAEKKVNRTASIKASKTA